MLGWLIALGYGTGSFSTWLAGAARIGVRLEEVRSAAEKKARAEWSVKSSQERYAREYAFFSLVGAGIRTFGVGLLWPIGLPIFLAFNKGKSVGLKKRQMRALLTEAEDEIARIKKQEGWS